MLMQSGDQLLYNIDGQLGERKRRDLQNIALVLMYADDIALVTETNCQMQAAIKLAICTFARRGIELRINKAI